MKRINKLFLFIIVAAAMTACNQKSVFPDFKYTTVYFPYQSPVRTIELGDDPLYNISDDNMHQCIIEATMGGVYSNTKDRIIKVAVDNSLCDSLRFESATGDSVIAMPSNYYSLPQDMSITIAAGSMMGGIKVQLTDAFFQDPRSTKNTFVIPLKMLSVTGADSILAGQSGVASPDPRVAGDWVTAPKNYVLYCIKYINPWTGAYLRRGVDVGTGNGGNTALDTTVTYHQQYVEQDQVCTMFTTSMNTANIALSSRTKGNISMPFTLMLNFSDSSNCTINAPANSAYTVSGKGEFVKNGDSWGNEPRDVLHLKYTVNLGSETHNLTDTLVMRDREVAFETFNPVVTN